MKQMKTIQFPDESEPYEVVDEAARNMLAEIEKNNNFASKEWVLEQLEGLGNCIYGTENLVIGSSPLTTGTFYFFINGDDRIVENVYIGVDDVADQWKPYVTGEFTLEETQSYTIAYEGDSPTVECPECLTYQDDGNGTLTFKGSAVGSGVIRMYNGYILVSKYAVTVTELTSAVVTLNLDKTFKQHAYAVINGTTYYTGKLTLPLGTVIQLYATKGSCLCGQLVGSRYYYLNGSNVSTAASYSYTVKGNVSISYSRSLKSEAHEGCTASYTTSVRIVEE